MNYSFIVVLCFVLCSSCREGNYNSLNDFEPKQIVKVNIADANRDDSFLQNSISEINIIPLDQPRELILSSSNVQMRVTDSNIYIYDWEQKQLFQFSKIGEYQHKIDRQGKGPGEYINAKNFTIDTSGNIYMNDTPNRNVLIYDRNGIFASKRKMFTGIEDFIYINDSISYMYRPSMPASENRCITKLKENKPVGDFLSIPSWISNSRTSSPLRTFFFYHDYIPKFIQRWDTHVFSLNTDSISCDYLIDFGENNVPSEFLESNKDDLNSDFMKYYSIFETNNWVTLIDFVQEQDTHLFFTFTCEDWFYCFYNKETQKVNTMRPEDLSLEWGLVLKPFTSSHKNSFFSLVRVDQLNLLDTMRDEIHSPVVESLLNQYDQYTQMLDRELEEDDYVLLEYKMKNS